MRYLIKKIIVLILTMFVISLFTFLAFHIIPGDPARLILGTSASEAKLEALRRQLGTDLPLHSQYINWITGFVRGDFGTSIRYSMPVKDLIGGHVTVTVLLGIMVMIMTLIVSIPLGIFAARKRGTITEQIIEAVTMTGISIPGFFLSILFMWVFGLVLHLFTPGNYVSYRDNPAGFFRFMFFPALAIAVPQIATLTKYVGMMIGSIFSGSIIVEQVFGVPGIGRLLIASVTGRDFPLTQTLVMYVAFVIVITNFIVDILIQLIDPRIRISE